MQNAFGEKSLPLMVGANVGTGSAVVSAPVGSTASEVVEALGLTVGPADRTMSQSKTFEAVSFRKVSR